MAATALLFDLDGTVWDSYPCYGAALGAPLGSSPEIVVARLKAGENVVALAGSAGISNTRFTRLCRSASSALRLYAGVEETLIEFERRGALLGVVTNIPQRLITPLLSDVGIATYFGSVICAARKPSPTGILRALAELKIDANKKVFFVGDSLTDALAARRAGVSFAWASYGYSAKCPQQTDVVIDSFPELLNLL